MEKKGNRIRVLVIAEAANPEWTSVPLVGWSLFSALTKVADVHLVTHLRNRDALIRKGLKEGRDFSAIDNESVAAPLFKLSEILRGGSGKGWTMVTGLSSIAYYSFENELWRQFSKRLGECEFDLVHRITPLSPTSPSIIARRLKRMGIPFVVGPLNGGLPWPKNFKGRQYQEREWLSHLRWMFRLLPGYHSTRIDSSAIIVGSKHTYSEMPDNVRQKCVYIPENAVELEHFNARRTPSTIAPLKAVFVGRLVPYKGADILIRAAREFLIAKKLELHVIGDGPQRPALEGIAAELGVRNHVHFHGWVPHVHMPSELGKYDFLALPSIREFGGGVVVEAMALGVTPVVADYGGPAELVDEATGIRVSFSDERSLVEGFRLAIGDLISSPQKLGRLGAAARAKALEHLTWEAKAKQILQVYEAVIQKTNNFQSLGLSMGAYPLR